MSVSDAIQVVQLFFEDLSASLVRSLAGLFFGAFFGVPLGAVTSSLPKADLILGSSLRFARAIPALAMLPFLLMVFGVSEFGRVFLISWGSFFPIWLSTHNGMRMIQPQLLRLGGEVYRTPIERYLYVRVLAALPYILSGVRISIGVSLVLLVAAEMMGARSGLAARMLVAQQLFQVSRVCFYIGTLGALGLLLDRVYLVLSRKCAPWIELSQGQSS
jgi:ABC-type nitrate/sulfonate/bicarbonate transport system permease component